MTDVIFHETTEVEHGFAPVFDGRSFFLALRGGRPFLGDHRLCRATHRILGCLSGG